MGLFTLQTYPFPHPLLTASANRLAKPSVTSTPHPHNQEDLHLYPSTRPSLLDLDLHPIEQLDIPDKTCRHQRPLATSAIHKTLRYRYDKYIGAK